MSTELKALRNRIIGIPALTFIAFGAFQGGALQVRFLVVRRYPRIAVFHASIVGQTYGTGNPLISGVTFRDKWRGFFSAIWRSRAWPRPKGRFPTMRGLSRESPSSKSAVISYDPIFCALKPPGASPAGVLGF